MTKTLDQTYFEAIKKGDKQGIKEIYSTYLPRITSFILKNNGTEDDAKDIFQEAIIVFFKKIKTGNFTLTASFYTYLYGICRNLWFQKLQKNHKKTVTFSTEWEFKDDTDVEQIIQTEERHKLFRAKFRELSENCQKLLQLFFQRTPMKEIVKIMGYGSLSYAKKRKFECKEKLVALVQNAPQFKDLL